VHWHEAANAREFADCVEVRVKIRERKRFLSSVAFQHHVAVRRVDEAVFLVGGDKVIYSNGDDGEHAR
jgi:hypothetical protein